MGAASPSFSVYSQVRNVPRQQDSSCTVHHGERGYGSSWPTNKRDTTGKTKDEDKTFPGVAKSRVEVKTKKAGRGQSERGLPTNRTIIPIQSRSQQETKSTSANSSTTDEVAEERQPCNDPSKTKHGHQSHQTGLEEQCNV